MLSAKAPFFLPILLLLRHLFVAEKKRPVVCLQTINENQKLLKEWKAEKEKDDWASLVCPSFL